MSRFNLFPKGPGAKPGALAALVAKEDGGLKVVARLKRCRDLASDLERHRRVVAATSAERFGGARTLQPKIALKYLHPRYLVKGLPTDDKAAIFIHHYATLERRLNAPFVKTLVSDGFSPWSFMGEDGEHSIWLGFSHPTDNEGELTLEYRHRGSLIYVMAFSFAPGSLAGRPDETILLLTRVQGAKNDFEAIRRAMKDLRGLSGAALLMSALQGIALGLGAKAILAVKANAQVCLTDGIASAFVAAYDDFFASLGGVTCSDKFFLIRTPIVERPLEEVKANNRSRVRWQRERKQAVLEAFTDLFHPPTRVHSAPERLEAFA